MNRIEAILQLRDQTGAGVMACSKAFDQSYQNFAQALATLQENAAVQAMKQTKREALEGMIALYSHNNGRIGVMVEINTETQFASHTSVFQDFAHEIALQIAASAPFYVCEEAIPAQALSELVSETAEKARRAGKTIEVIDKIVQGVLEKYRKEQVLLNQAYIRDESITIEQLLNQKISQIGENIVIRRFERWEIAPDADAL